MEVYKMFPLPKMGKICVAILSVMMISKVLSQQSGFTAFKFKQNAFKATFERFEVEYYNKEYVRYMSGTTYKYNRTCPVANLTFTPNIDLGNDLNFVIQANKFLSNEYRHFPIRFQINTCDAIAEDAFGISSIKKCGNFSGCPILKNIRYHICNWSVDESKFPPLIPNGEYMFHLQASFHGADVGSAKMYVSITQPIPIPKK